MSFRRLRSQSCFSSGAGSTVEAAPDRRNNAHLVLHPIKDLEWSSGCESQKCAKTEYEFHQSSIHARIRSDEKWEDCRTIISPQAWGIHSTQKINDVSYNQLISDPSTYVKKRAQRDSILLRHLGDVVGTGPDEQLMSDL